MGLNNKTTLKNQANLIRYEDGDGENTAERVGKVISEIIENADQSLTTETTERVQQYNALQQSVTIASNTATTAYNEAKDAKSKVATAQSTANAAKTPIAPRHMCLRSTLLNPISEAMQNDR